MCLKFRSYDWGALFWSFKKHVINLFFVADVASETNGVGFDENTHDVKNQENKIPNSSWSKIVTRDPSSDVTAACSNSSMLPNTGSAQTSSNQSQAQSDHVLLTSLLTSTNERSHSTSVEQGAASSVAPSIHHLSAIAPTAFDCSDDVIESEDGTSSNTASVMPQSCANVDGNLFSSEASSSMLASYASSTQSAPAVLLRHALASSNPLILPSKPTPTTIDCPLPLAELPPISIAHKTGNILKQSGAEPNAGAIVSKIPQQLEQVKLCHCPQPDITPPMSGGFQSMNNGIGGLDGELSDICEFSESDGDSTQCIDSGENEK